MGKGRIVSGGEDGLYTVELLHNRERIDAEINFLTAKLADLQAEVDALNAERDGLVAERNAIATDIDTAVATAEEGEIPDVEALLVDLAQVSAQIQQQGARIAMIRGRMLESTKRKEQLEAVPADPQQQAWCADYTEDLTGEVATVEVPAEGVVGQFATSRRVIIRPGYEGRADYADALDGQMFHREGQAGYQAYLNAAILPGVQRWKPQYRIGVITSVDTDTDTCSLTIQSENSSAQSLAIDPPDLQFTKTGVPIEYMECDAEAFEAGDRVLVEFQGRDWSAPKVIGFESEPKPCLPNYIVMTGRNYLSEPDHVPVDVWNLAQDTLLRRVFVGNGRLFRTTLIDGLTFVDWTLPPDVTIENGLFVSWWSWRMAWDRPSAFSTEGAVFYNDVVGGEAEDISVNRPDEFASNDLLLFKPDIQALDGIEDANGGWVRTLKMQGIQLPTGAEVPPQWDIYEEIDDGSSKMYRYTIDSYVDYPTDGSPIFDLLTYGSYSLEVVTEWEQTGLDFENFILAESIDTIPTTLTISSTTNPDRTLAVYTREKIGKVGREFNSSSELRWVAVVWRKEGEPPPTYAAGFWVDE